MEHRGHLLARVLVLTFAAAHPPPGRAADFYVDAALGDDGHSGTSPSEPWRTLTHALATVPTPGGSLRHRILVGPGIYDSAAGETFHLELRHGIDIVGAGSALTVVDGGSAGGPVIVASSDGSGGPAGEQEIAGVTLQGGGQGLFVRADGAQAVSVVLRDVTITGSGDAGVSVWVDALSPLQSGSSARLVLLDCRVEANGGTGIVLWNAGEDPHATLDAELVTTRIRATGRPGFSSSAMRSCRRVISDSIAAR